MDVRTAVSESSSAARALRLLRKQHGKETYDWLRRIIAEEDLDTSHWGTARSMSKTTVADLCADGVKSRNQIRRLLINENLCPYVCAVCGSLPEWQGKPLVLRLDHINGVHYDHRLENLRFMCPNCDSQLDTFAGRNVKRKRAPSICLDCGVGISKHGVRCLTCNGKVARPRAKRQWPDYVDLLRMIDDTSMSQVAAGLDVSKRVLQQYISRKSRPVHVFDRKTKTCSVCSVAIDGRSKTNLCRSHRVKRTSKIEWPSTEELLYRVNASSFTAVAKELGVSDNAIRKRIRTRALTSPK